MFSLYSLFKKSAKEKSSFRVIDYKSFSEKVKISSVQLIDVRTPDEYRKGHLFHAKNINFFDPHFTAQISKLDPKRPVCLYCQSGMRSRKVAHILSKNGFKEIYDLEGGYLNGLKYQQT